MGEKRKGKLVPQIDCAALKRSLQLYGLYKVNINGDKFVGLVNTETEVFYIPYQFNLTKSNKIVSSFKGAVNTLEAFFNLKAMTLNVKTEQYLSK